MIRIFEQGHEDFSTMGLGEIRPLSCVVREELGGAYELDIEMAMDDEQQYDRLMPGRVIVVPVPSITTPAVKAFDVTSTEKYKLLGSTKMYSQPSDVMGTTETVSVPSRRTDENLVPFSARLLLRDHLGRLSDEAFWTEAYTFDRWIPNGNRVLQTLKAFTHVTLIKKTNATWWRVTSAEGNTGYVLAEKLEFVEVNAVVPGETIQSRQTREQAFRIYRVEKDTGTMRVKAYARHIYYDLLGVVVKRCKVPKMNVGGNLGYVSDRVFPGTHGFEFLTNAYNVLPEVDYTHRSLVDAHLNPDDGIAARGNLRVVRDNFSVFFLKRSTTVRGTITYGRNLIGVNLDVDTDGVINVIIPVGKDADGEILYKNNTYPHVASPRNTSWTEIRCQAIDYDVSVGEDFTKSEAQQELVALAQADFEKGIDLPDVSVSVDFLQLGDTEEYAQYRDLDRLYLTDVVRIIDTEHGIDIEAEVTEYEFDCLGQHYLSMGVGMTKGRKTLGSVGSFMLPNGGISGYKLALGSVDGSRLEAMSVKTAQIGMAAIDTLNVKNGAIQTAQIGDLQVTTAKLAEATVGDLTAASVTAVEGEFEKITAGTLTSGSIFAGVVDAVKARIGYLIAQNLTADELYARIATIAVAQITAANIESANITWADIENLTAAIANIAIGEIGTADIDWAHIKDLATETAIITEGLAGELYIARLAVTDANIVNLTTGKLVVRGDDGSFYQITIDENGTIIPKLEQVFDADLADAGTVIDEDENIIYGGITAGKLDVQSIFAEDAVIKSLIAENIDVDELFAREATIDSLNAKLLLTDNYITVTNAISGIESELTENKSYIRLGKLINSDNAEGYGIAIGKSLQLDEDGNIVRDSTAVQITSDRQTFYQNGVVGMELKDGGITAGHGNFGHTTVGGKWKTTVDANGTYAVMWVG